MGRIVSREARKKGGALRGAAYIVRHRAPDRRKRVVHGGAEALVANAPRALRSPEGARRVCPIGPCARPEPVPPLCCYSNSVITSPTQTPQFAITIAAQMIAYHVYRALIVTTMTTGTTMVTSSIAAGAML